MVRMHNYYYKGSKRMLQILATEYTDLLEKAVGEKIEWISPKEVDGYKEYQLNGPFVREALGIPKGEFEGFWPNRQPQWDGIAVAKESRTLYLIEAKSRISELRPGNTLDINNEQNQDKIDNYRIKSRSIITIAADVYGVPMTDEMKVSWTAKHYQVSNRLTFLEKMKSLTGIIPFTRVRLLFINFYNDPTWRDDGLTVKSSKDWEDKYDSIFRDLGNIKEKVYQHGVSIINIDASGY